MDDSLKAQIAAGRKLGASDEVEPIDSPGDPLGSPGDEDQAGLIGGDPTRQIVSE